MTLIVLCVVSITVAGADTFAAMHSIYALWLVAATMATVPIYRMMLKACPYPDPYSRQYNTIPDYTIL